MPSISASRPSPSMTPSERSSGVDRFLWRMTSVPLSNAKSVKVPPISIPTRYFIPTPLGWRHSFDATLRSLQGPFLSSRRWTRVARWLPKRVQHEVPVWRPAPREPFVTVGLLCRLAQLFDAHLLAKRDG